MNRRFWMALFTIVALPGLALANDWKDESGKGRDGPPPWIGSGGEPPDLASGKGVWDGHVKHGDRHVYRHDIFRLPSWSNDGQYPPYLPPVLYISGRVVTPEDYRVRLQDRQTREPAASFKPQEQTRAWNQKRRAREAYQEWQVWQREYEGYPSPPLRYPGVLWR